MAVNGVHDCEDDDYIDMEVSSYSNIFRQSICSPPHHREFEFQMSANSLQKPTTTSPADELFYQGKLLPLHLPPRLQMVKKLLENTDSAYECRTDTFEEVYGTPLMTAATTPTATSTPFESCNISPVESCGVSRELNPEDYFLECSTEASDFISENTKKSWTKKLKLMKQYSLGSKLKASRAYLKSWFGKSSADSCKGAAKVADEGTISKANLSLYNHVKAAKKAPFGQIHRDKYVMATVVMSNKNKQKISDGGSGHLHRRSFSMAIRRNLTTKSSLSSSSLSSGSSSSSSSKSSNGSHRLPYLKRSSSTNSEMENPIQGAIAHCKQSQQLFLSRTTASHEV